MIDYSDAIRLKDTAIYVMAIPNGWFVSQHSFLRRVAVSAGLVKESDVQKRVLFVSEAEASVHFMLQQNDVVPDEIFAVVDAGGSTVDSTLYRCVGISPKLLLEEVCSSECIQVCLFYIV